MVLLALSSAVAFGINDFGAGLLARRRPVELVGLGVNLVGAVFLVALASILGGVTFPDLGDAAWILVGGVGSAVGTLGLYRGLARGKMAVAGPLSALLAATIPAVVGLLGGERPTPLTVFGLFLALPAIWLSSGGRAGRGLPKPEPGTFDGLVAGVGFAALFIGLSRAGTVGGLTAPALCQVVAAVVLMGLILVRRDAKAENAGWRVDTRLIVSLAALGCFSGIATGLYFLAARDGLLSIVAVLASLYPALTIGLARVILGERITRGQQLGLVTAAFAVAFVITG